MLPTQVNNLPEMELISKSEGISPILDSAIKVPLCDGNCLRIRHRVRPLKSMAERIFCILKSSFWVFK